MPDDVFRAHLAPFMDYPALNALRITSKEFQERVTRELPQDFKLDALRAHQFRGLLVDLSQHPVNICLYQAVLNEIYCRREQDAVVGGSDWEGGEVEIYATREQHSIFWKNRPRGDIGLDDNLGTHLCESVMRTFGGIAEASDCFEPTYHSSSAYRLKIWIDLQERSGHESKCLSSSTTSTSCSDLVFDDVH